MPPQVGISFYEFNPREWPPVDFTPPALIFYLKVGGGFFTGRYNAMNEAVEGGSRFDPNKMQGQVGLMRTSNLKTLCTNLYGHQSYRKR